MRCSLSSNVVALAVVALAGACGFIDATPPGAIVLCTASAECAHGLDCAKDHVCRKPGADVSAPSVVSARFDPPATRREGTVSFVVEADAALADDVVPALHFASSEIAFGAPAATDDRTRTWVVDAATLEEGFYIVDRVTLTGANGVVATRPILDGTLEIDDTPPALGDVVLVNPPADGIYADVDALRTNVTVRFSSNDVLDLENTRISIGALTSGACVASSIGSLVTECSINLASGGAPDGANVPLVIVVKDDASNEATASLGVHVDSAPPGVISAALTIHAGQTDIAAAVPGSDVVVELTTNEPIDPAQLPVATLHHGAGSAEMTVEGGGQTFTLTHQVVEAAVDPTPGFVTLTMFDIVGHRADITILDGAVPFAPSIVAACEIGPIACEDFDGDGVSPNPACSLPPDCNDIDPTIAPSTFEIPGDGKDNDCAGGDIAATALASVVFVDDGLSVNGVGSAADPFKLVATAVAAGADNIVLSGGLYELGDTPIVDANLFGGFSASTWTPNGSTTTIEWSSGPLGLGDNRSVWAVQFDGPGFNDVYTSARAQLVDVGVSNYVQVVDDALLVRVRGGVTVQVPAIAARVIESNLSGAFVESGAFFHRVHVGGQLAAIGDQARVTITSSVVDVLSDTPTLLCSQCASLDVLFSNVIHRPELGGVSSVVAVSGTHTRLWGTLLFSFEAVPMIEKFGSGELVVVDDDFAWAGSPDTLLVGSGVGYDSDVALDACDEGGPCTEARGTHTEAPGFVAGDRGHIDVDSLLIDVATAGLTADMPGSVIADLDGDCHDADTQLDIGADEVR